MATTGSVIQTTAFPTAHASAAGGAPISATLLLPQERISRAPLVPWADRLLARLARCRAEAAPPRDLAAEVAGISNNAALIAAHHGQLETARRLCEQQFRWQCRLGRETADPVISAHALQPWVNVARLDAMVGEWAAALRRLERLVDYRDGGEVVFGGESTGTPDWAAILEAEPGFLRVLENMLVLDSLKALLQNRRFGELRAGGFVPPPGPRPSLQRLHDEAMVVAACRLGDLEAAERRAREAVQASRGWVRAVFLLRRAEVLACAGTASGAAKILRSLADVLTRLSSDRKAELNALHVIHRIATACLETGLEEEAVLLAHDIRRGAAVAEDEALQIESLRILARYGPAPERDGWADALSRLQASTAYARYRAPGAAPTLHPRLGRLFSVLSAFIEA